MNRRVVWRLSVLMLGCFLVMTPPVTVSARADTARLGGDWTRFGYDAARSNAGPAASGISAANVGTLKLQQIELDGTVDSSPLYVRSVIVGRRGHDIFVVTTTYGKTLAIDADSGAILWRFTPRKYSSWAGSTQITTATPVIDRRHGVIFAPAPDGRIHKLVLASGREIRSGGWPAAVTRSPAFEKLSSALNLSRGLVLATTSGYFDNGTYQGHLVAIDAKTGRRVSVWNSLCSRRRLLLVPTSCPQTGGSIWGRSAPVVVPGSGNLLVATGNGPWDGVSSWGDSVLELSPDGTSLLANWTPANELALDSLDLDLGSSAPAVLTSRLAAQVGKDGILRLLDLQRLNGQMFQAGAFKGGELQTIATRGAGQGFYSWMQTVWKGAGKTWLYTADFYGVDAYVLRGGRLQLAWRSFGTGGNPVVAGGLLYVTDWDQGGLVVLDPQTGEYLLKLPGSRGHWGSPVITDGRIAFPEGNANDHLLRGILNIYRLP